MVRLKDKLGTRPLPTAELRLTGMRALKVGSWGGRRVSWGWQRLLSTTNGDAHPCPTATPDFRGGAGRACHLAARERHETA